MKRPSVFYVTENGTTRYGMTRSYGGLAGITLRLLTHATDGYGISIPYFERLKPMKEISEDEFQTYADHPETADDLYSFAEIDVDKNVLRIDEDWKEERSYREYPLQLLLAQCALPGFVDSKNEEKTERNAGYLVVSQSGGGMLRQGTREGIRRTPANRGMRAHRVVKGLDISEDVCHGLCP